MNLCSSFAFRGNREPLCGSGDDLPSLDLHGKCMYIVTSCEYHTFVSRVTYKHCKLFFVSPDYGYLSSIFLFTRRDFQNKNML